MKRKHFTAFEMTTFYRYFDQSPLDPVNISLEILALTGMRPCEYVWLRFNDVSIRNKTIEVIPAKGSNPRSAPISMGLAQRIEEVRLAHKLDVNDRISDLVSGAVMDRVRLQVLERRFNLIKAWHWRADWQKLPCLYGFRHTVALKVLESSSNIYLAKLALGHKSVTSTERYLTGFDYRKLEAILGKR